MQLCDLPIEIIHKILILLDHVSIVDVKRVNSMLRNFLRNRNIWFWNEYMKTHIGIQMSCSEKQLGVKQHCQPKYISGLQTQALNPYKQLVWYTTHTCMFCMCHRNIHVLRIYRTLDYRNMYICSACFASLFTGDIYTVQDILGRDYRLARTKYSSFNPINSNGLRALYSKKKIVELASTKYRVPFMSYDDVEEWVRRN